MRKIALFVWILLVAEFAVATEIPENDWEYSRLDDDSVAIYNEDQSRQRAAIDTATAGDIAIPDTLRNMRVTSIGENAFYNCSNITSVVIPEGVTNIGNKAFYGCCSLQNVEFPRSLKSIGNNAFNSCTSLLEIAFSGNVQLKIDESVFLDCNSLSNFVFLGESVSLGKYAFGGCAALTNLTLSAKVVNIADYATSYYDDRYVYECDQLKTFHVVATNSLTIGANAFYDCNALADVTLKAEKAAVISSGAFKNCAALKSIDLPSSLTEVSSESFANCKSLASISFTTNLKTIAKQAFDTCTLLSNVSFVEGLTSIDDQAFYGCETLNELKFPQSLSKVGSRVFEKSGVQTITFAGGDTNIFEATSLTLDSRAFYKCSNLRKVDLPQRLIALPERIFADCEALEEINLSTNLTSIADSAFEYCSSLPTIDFPTNLLDIGNSAFKGCTSLTGFLIPTNNLVELGAQAFYNTKYWNDYKDNSLVTNNGYILGFKGNPTEVILPDTCRAIPDGMFEGMSSLTSITLPASVTSIGKRAFVGTGIRELVASNVVSIGSAAFSDCTALTNIVLSSQLASIPAEMLKNCESLLSIFIPESVTAIGEYAFYNCQSLLNVSGGDGVVTVGDYAFAKCISLEPFEFAKEVTYGDHVFQGCVWTEHVLYPSIGTLKDEYPSAYTNIKSIVFSANVTSIVDNACLGCYSLESLKIPSSVKRIGNNSFSGCNALTSVVFTAGLSSFGTNVFHDCKAIVSVVVYGDRSVKSIFEEQYGYLSDISISENSSSLCDDMFAGCAALSTINIPESVTSIGSAAFASCSKLIEVSFPTVQVEEDAKRDDGFLESDIEIGEAAFSNCTRLIAVELPLGIKTLPESAFCGCTSLTNDSFEIPYTVTEIGQRAFWGCSSLTGITLPEKVTTIGDYAFCNCTNLTIVRYLGAKPSDVGDNIYKYTKKNLITGWNSRESKSWSETTNGAPYFTSSRKAVMWDSSKLYPCCKVTFNYNNGKDSPVEVFYIKGRVLGFLMKDPMKDSTDDYGWYTQKIGGNRYGQYTEMTDALTLYAHWSVSSGSGSASDDDDDDDDDDESESDDDDSDETTTGRSDVEWNTGFYPDDDKPFSYAAAVFDGYLMDGDEIAGVVTFKSAKGKRQNDGGTNSTFSVTIQRLGSKSKITLKGTVDEEGHAEASKGDYSFQAELTAFGLSGTFEDESDEGGSFTIQAARDRYSAKSDEAKYAVRMARAAAVGNWTVGLKTGSVEDLGGGSMAYGYSVLSVTIASSGKAKVTGMMADGTKVSVSSTLIVGDGCCCLPVVVPLYTGKKGGFAFALWFSWTDEYEYAEGGLSLNGLTIWDASMNKAAPFTAEFEDEYLFSRSCGSTLSGTAEFELENSPEISDMEIAEEFLPNGTEITLKGSKLVLPKADKVKFDREEGWINNTEDFANPAALKLTYTIKTGLFKGQFKVYCTTESGKSKTYTATVNGLFFDSTTSDDSVIGYGTATIKKQCSVPVIIIKND